MSLRGGQPASDRSRAALHARLPLPLADTLVDPRVGARGPALLALEGGTVFPGVAFGADAAAGEDLVVNTSQTGYQGVCTDPSYAGQVVVMTYPLIGNYGRIRADDQSERPWLRALVVATATAAVAEQTGQLAALLRDEGIPAIAGVDTRALARHLRTQGSLRGIVTSPGETDAAEAIGRARRVPRWEDQDLRVQSPGAADAFRALRLAPNPFPAHPGSPPASLRPACQSRSCPSPTSGSPTGSASSSARTTSSRWSR